MERQKFDQVLQVTVLHIGKEFLARHPKASWLPNWQEKLFEEYDKHRLIIRDKMQLTPEMAEHRIDRHKIASAMALAILRVRPLCRNTDTSAGARLANELLAILSGAAIVWRFVVEGIKKNHPTEASKYHQAKFAFPPASDCPYTTHACRMLYLHPDGGGDLVLANMFFLLEAYRLQAIDGCKPPIDPTADEVNQASI